MKKTIIMFSGQGSQYSGMGKDLYDKYSVVKKLYTMASDILNIDFVKLCFYSDNEELIKTQNAQLTTFLLSYSMYQVYLEMFQIIPLAVCGHSLGEITALSVSKVITFEDTLRIVQKRGLLMSDDSKVKKGKMFAVFNASIQSLENLCNDMKKAGKYITIANYNSNSQTILSGEESITTEDLKKKLACKTVFPLRVSGAFHSKLMSPIAEEFYEYIKKFKYFEPMIPIISSINAEISDGSIDVLNCLKTQLISPVRWSKVMEKFMDLDVSEAVEIGPKEVLAKFSKENLPNIKSVFAKQYL